MSLKLYNSLTKREEEFQPMKPGEVTIYTCGPTVYGRPHVGNYSSFLTADLLRRWLEVGHNLKVTHVKNITDVGHLVADGDEGEDKVEKQAREEFGSVTHESVIGIARKYEREYLEDEKALNMKEPEHRPRATDFIEQMKAMINGLLESNHAYVIDDGIYFDVSAKLPTAYGTLSGNTLENLCAGSRVEVNPKKHCPADFALWKFCVGKNERHALRWPSPGKSNPEGFPGWHIECSAMSRALLGDEIDIHTGGEDNIFPHHECEIAQSESVTGKKPFVKLWLHKRRIALGDEKMSKSLGNVKTISDITAAGYSPMDLRYYLLSVHYRTQLKFSEKGLEDAHKARRKILEWMNEVDSWQPSTGSKEHWSAQNVRTWWEQLLVEMDSDLNTPAALAIIFDAMTQSRLKAWESRGLQELRSFVTRLQDVFGCFDPEVESISEEVETLRHLRDQARARKDFAESDRLRDELIAMGYEVRDTEKGTEVKRK